ncbi:MerR family transcriptional regulator [Neobacillus vireti]|uniref:Chromosome-anchoring protein RacA n=1 Tax=Neobacillus vireti LMG 21834 TaxID=1131730 RepID=A0AB94IMG8_9BACI|nr:MerR family transcriptional regulator [Neobacillus vireti]ETI68168.1 polar chromosome segregation protein [Neobacillus vireti LMG 21834]KLT17387.1 chromosome segregation protein [Neobacillus vireti]
MNTSEVAKLLGVSASTIQRWVKLMELPMERNERGHYHFNSEDIELLKTIHEQLQNGRLLQDLSPVIEKKRVRKGAVKLGEKETAMERLVTKVSELEISLNSKADSVTSYQILQHRREIDDLQNHVTLLALELERLQIQIKEMNTPPQLDKPLVLNDSKVKRKKKNIVSSLFGF